LPVDVWKIHSRVNVRIDTSHHRGGPVAQLSVRGLILAIAAGGVTQTLGELIDGVLLCGGEHLLGSFPYRK
jgi:hypothetical protein